MSQGSCITTRSIDDTGASLNGRLICELGTLAANQTATISIELQRTFEALESVQSIIEVRAEEPDPVRSNNETSVFLNPGQLSNISTRGLVGIGDEVLIGGLIVGEQPTQVLIRAQGPSLAGPPSDLSGVINDQTLELLSGQTSIIFNDNWQSALNRADIEASGLAPNDTREPAILITLDPGLYTAIVRGVDGAQGIGIVEAFKQSSGSGGDLSNISTRGFIGTGDQVLIGGVIVIEEPTRVLIRAQGPSLAAFGVSGVINDPTVELLSGQNTIASNDDWQSAVNRSEIEESGLAPSDTREPAILITLEPGSYTAIVRGANGVEGIGIVEVFKLDD